MAKLALNSVSLDNNGIVIVLASKDAVAARILDRGGGGHCSGNGGVEEMEYE